MGEELSGLWTDPQPVPPWEWRKAWRSFHAISPDQEALAELAQAEIDTDGFSGIA